MSNVLTAMNSEANNWIFGDDMGITFNNYLGMPKLIEGTPNPFSTYTTIENTLDKPQLVTINVFDALGNEIETLTNDYQTSGKHEAAFNAERFAPGMYYYTVQIGQRVESDKPVVVR